MRRHTEIVAQLLRQDFAVMPDFVDTATIDNLRAEQQDLFERGLAHPAGIGQGRQRQLRPDIRGDEILWLDPTALSPVQNVYWQAIDCLRRDLNAALFLSLSEFEAHFARYRPGCGYARHRDTFQSDTKRVLSCSLYLNPAWTAADGGALRLHLPTATPIDILPTAATLVIFKSQALEHEVLSARRARLSLTGWLKCR